MKSSMKQKALFAIIALFGSHTAWSQAGHGNGGSDYVLKSLADSLKIKKTSLTKSSYIIKDDANIIENEELRLKTCKDFYKTYFEVMSGLTTISASTGEKQRDFYDHLRLTPSLPDNLANPRDLRNAILNNDEKYYCSDKHFKIATLPTPNGLRYVAVNSHDDALLMVDPSEWNKRLRTYSPWCEDLSEKAQPICLARVRNAIAMHEVIAMIYNSFETKNSYYYSLFGYLDADYSSNK